MTETWSSETVQAWVDTESKVYVFRWVPDFAPGTGPRTEHPTFDEWLDDMRQAAEGLESPMVATDQFYDTTRVGVSGHRPATDAERDARIEELKKDILHRRFLLNELEMS